MVTDVHTYPEETVVFTATLPRSGFGPRLTARAGEVWRAMQDVVADQSNSVGWTPEAYVKAGTMFVVRSMTVRHAREVKVDEVLTGRTWPSKARRAMLFTRQVRMFDTGKTLVASATQEWALLTVHDLQPTRAGQELFDAFKIYEGHPDLEELPAPRWKEDAQPQRFEFTVWHGWMDPNGHANHAAYVDYCDEAVARILASEGKDPQRVVAIAETVHFRAAITGGDVVTVETLELPSTPEGRLFTHRLLVNGKVCATATLLRTLA